MSAGRDEERLGGRPRGATAPLRSEPAPPRTRIGGRALLAALAVALLVALVQAPVLDGRALTLDDDLFLTANEHVLAPSWRGAGRVLVELGEASPVGGYYTPLSVLSLMADAAAGGSPENLRPFHRTSLALHAANAALVVLLLWLLFGDLAAACALGLLFGLHPITVEPVAWIAGRKIVLSAFFALIALTGHTARARGGGRAGTLVALPALVLACLTHPSAVMVPVLFLVLDLWPLGRRPAVREALPYLAVSALAGVAALVTQARSVGVEVPAAGGENLGASLPLRLAFYARQLLWPTGLAPVHALAPPGGAAAVALWGGTLAVLAAAVVAARRRPGTRAPLAGLAFFVVALLPTLGLVRYSWVEVADKYLYLPSLGLLLVLAGALVRLGRSGAGGVRRAVLVLLLALAGLEGALSREYAAAWSDSETLFRHTASVSPSSPGAHVLYATWLSERGRDEEALEQYRRAAELAPTTPLVQYDLGNALSRCGEPEAAVAAYDAALAADPDHVGALFNRGKLHYALGDVPAAEADFRAALERDPELAGAHNELGNCRFRSGDLAGAAESYERALALEPQRLEAHRNLAALRLTEGRYADAVRHYGDAVGLRPDDAELRFRLGLALELAGRREQATVQLERALALDPDHAGARKALAAIEAERP